MIVHDLEVFYYLTLDGKCPYKQWFIALGDMAARQVIDARLTRLERGILGEYRWIGDGVLELKFRVGPGYRIYFGKRDKKWIILLCGGDKSSQQRDIEKAKQYWEDYLRKKNAKTI